MPRHTRQPEQPATPQPTIFVSYARSDDARAPFVAELHAALTSAGFEAWWDQKNMPGRGLTFLQEIRDAIHSCERLIVLLGPGAAQSDYVRAEWQYALAVGKVVNPILVAGSLDQLPPELRNLDCPDASSTKKRKRAVQHLLRLLADPVPALGALLTIVPETPAHFQPRLDEVSSLADKVLLDTRRPVVTKPEQRITLVHGIPGAGKSVVAAAFARSTEVRRAFSGGVVWIRCGREASPRQVVAAVCVAIGVTGPGPRGLAEALRPALEEALRLVVLDDVWSIDCILPFVSVLGPRSRLVATTRQAELQASLGCLGLIVGSLSEDAALRQLADWSGVAVDALPPEARATARKCGGLPFALALCGAMVRDGVRWVDLLANLRSARLGFLNKRIGDYPYRNVQRAMAVSLDALRRDHRAAARRYLELAVFLAGTRVPVHAICRLWAAAGATQESAVRKTLALLQGKSLLRLVGDQAEEVELHDLQWDFIAASMPKTDALHRRLLTRYRKRLRAGLHAAPPGDYIVKQAAYHLEGAGQTEALFALIDRRWFERKFATEALRESFKHDVECAIHAALAAPRRELATLARFALIRATLDALAMEVPASALYVLARCGQVDLALDAARSAEDLTSQAHFHSLIASGLRDSGELVRARQVAAIVIEQGGAIEGLRANVLSWAAQFLAEIKDVSAGAAIDRAIAACTADGVSRPVSDAMVQTATAAFTHGRRSEMLRLLAAAEASWRRYASHDDQDVSLAAIASGWMRAGDLRRALRLIDSRVGSWRRDRAARSWSPPVALLGHFALACAEAGQPRVAARIWARTNARDRRDHHWAWYAAMLAARLGRAAEAQRFARRFAADREEPQRTQTLASTNADICTHLLAAGRRRDALRLVERTLALLARATPRPASTSRSARHVTIGETLRDRERAEVGCTLAETLVDCGEVARAVAIARSALQASATFRWDLRLIGEAEGAIALVHATQARSERALAIARDIADDYARDECFARLVRAFAAGGRIHDTLRAARSIDSETYSDWHRSRVLADDALAALPPALLPRVAARLVAAISDADARCRALGWLATQLGPGWLEPAVRAWADADPPRTDPAAMLSIARAAQDQPEEPGIRTMIEPMLFDLGDAKRGDQILRAEAAARLVVLWHERGESGRLVAAADGEDSEYAAAALSRVALVFVEAGWVDEARRAAERAMRRAARIVEGRPYAVGDVNTRLARVMYRLGEQDRAHGLLTKALAALTLSGAGWTSTYGHPKDQLEAIGVFMAEALEPQAALRMIIDIALPESGRQGDANHAIAGLFRGLLTRRGAGAARQLESAIEASRAGCDAWLRVRLAAAWHQHGDLRGAIDRFAKALEQGAHGTAGGALDVVTEGAPILGALDSGRNLEQVYLALRDLQRWAAEAGDSRSGPVFKVR